MGKRIIKRASQRAHHIVYKTTCLVTDKFYIGLHSTDDLNDGYIGSGQRLWHSINKHGKDKHQCVVLEHFLSRELAALRETELIATVWKIDPLCMNNGAGGLGMTDRPMPTAKVSAKISAKLKEHYASEAGKATKQRLRETQQQQTRSPETREKMAIAKRGASFTSEHRAKLSAAKRGKPLTEKQRANHRTGRERACTLDGITVYPSHAALVKVHGHGKTGGRSPHIRYI